MRARLTIAQLAKLLGETPDAMRRWMRSEGVPVHGGGRRGRPCYVLLHELQAKAGHIYEATAALRDSG